MRLDRPDHMTRRFAQINATVFVTQQGLDPGYVPYVAALIVLFMEIERKERYGSSSVDSLS
ncbi:MAG: hypothetical protein D6790_15025 [Caldilineae bacterium]|nr:MAG: hypothetical protein D6790_15025 [Caldilineae bacterium]